MPYNYRIYGLEILSDFQIDDLIEGGNGKDVRIIYGQAKLSGNDIIRKGKTFEIAKNEVIFKVNDVGYFLIKNGNEIVFEKNGNAKSDEIKLYLLGIVMGILFHQKREIIIHANGININGKGILICGASGSGKSTITAGLINKGYKFITDDLALIKFLKDMPFVIPGIPRLKLFTDSINSTMVDSLKKTRIKQDIEKFNLFIPDSFYPDETRVYKIYVLNNHEKKNIELINLSGTEKFNMIHNQFYLKFFTEIIWDREILFNKISNFADKVMVAIINHPKNWKEYYSLLDIIIKDIENSKKI